ncbi:MAG: VWA domain-containing protein [Candidatus Hodarchaeota archaeon]
MADVNLEVLNGGNLKGRAHMNPTDMEKIGVDDFDLIIFYSEFEDWGSAQVVGKKTTSVGYVQIDEAILESANISEGDSVRIKKKEAVGEIREVQIGVEPMEGQETEESVFWVAENVGGLAELLKKRPVYRNLEVDWRDAEIGHLKLRIIQTTPELFTEDVGIIDSEGGEVIFEIVPAVDMTFNAVLIIDSSGSMMKEDLTVKDIDGAVEGLRKGLAESSMLNKFLAHFEEGAWVSRIRAAALSTLLYLSLKIGRGWGENVQIISFSDEVDPLEFQSSTVIRCTGEAKTAGIEAIADHVMAKTETASGLTYMSGAIKKTSDLIPEFPLNPKTGRPNPVMVVLLTDGQPNKGEPPAIPVNPIPVLRRLINAHPNAVVYTIGLGEADFELLNRMAEIGRGEFFNATSFDKLWKWYDTLAQRFSIAVSTGDVETVDKTPSEDFEEFETDDLDDEFA